ncbi:lipid droplet-associated protein [Prauserella shujinwangii]|nr:lipid droplet-associated protein [Prauserella shujinwangii]
MKQLPFPLRVAAGLAVTTAERVRELPKQLTGLPVTVASQVLQASMRVQQHVTELAIKGDDALSMLRPVEESPSWATFDEDIEPDLSGPATPAEPVPTAGPPASVTPIDSAFDTSRAHGFPGSSNGRPVPPSLGEPAAEDPWAEEERALAEDHADGEFDSPDGTPAGSAAPDVLPESAQELDGPEPAGPAAASEPSTFDTPREPGGPAGAPGGLTGYDELTLPQVRARLRRLSLADLEEILAYERAHANRPSFVGMLTRRIGNVRSAGSGSEDQPEQ